MKKARCAAEARTLEAIPNIGTAVAAILREIEIKTPEDLVGRDPYALYEEVCVRTGTRQDPCLLDILIAAARFMAGGPVEPWWHFTEERKRRLSSLP